MSEVAREVFGVRFAAASAYVDILAAQGVEWGLIGPREADRLWDRHVLNSVAVADLIPAEASVVDVGSGAGLPGIPLAILRPDLDITLVEPLLRRSAFLTQAVEKLGITGQVTVVRARAEEHRQTYVVVLSRALAPLDRLIRWCEPLRAPDGMTLAIKGASAGAEVSRHAALLKSRALRAAVLVVRAHAGAVPTTVVRLTAA